MTVVLRRAKGDDLDAVVELEYEIFVNDAWTRETMRAEFEGSEGYYLVAVDDEPGGSGPRLLGYAGLLAPRGGIQGDIQTIAVVPGARGKGLGRQLMNALIARARRAARYRALS